MKKILCVIVAVVLCFGAVLVSASAETPMYNYNGVSMPYPPKELENTDFKYFLIFRESSGSYTMAVTNNKPYVSAPQIYLGVGSSYVFYSYSSDDGWVRFGGSDSIASEAFVGYKEDIFWSSYNLLDKSGNIVFSGDTSFVFPLPQPPLHEEINGVTGEAVNGLSNDIFDALGVLVPIGIGIMAVFVGVALIPRVIFKFL